MGNNVSTIENAFRRLTARKDETVGSCLCALMDAALDALHEAHEKMRTGHNHESESNTLGWCVIHGGEIVMAASQSKGPFTPAGDVLMQLRMAVSDMPKTGWCGILMSDMANEWYRVDWEIDFMTYSAETVKRDFRKIFRPIAR